MQPIFQTYRQIYSQGLPLQQVNWHSLFEKIKHYLSQSDMPNLSESHKIQIEEVLSAIGSVKEWVDELLNTQDEKLIPVLRLIFQLCKQHPLVKDLPSELEKHFFEILATNQDLLCHFMIPSALASKIKECFSQQSNQELGLSLLFLCMRYPAEKLIKSEIPMTCSEDFTQKDHEWLYVIREVLQTLTKDTLSYVIKETLFNSLESTIEKKSRDYPYFSVLCYSLSSLQWEESILPFLARETDPEKLFDLCQETALMARNISQHRRFFSLMQFVTEPKKILVMLSRVSAYDKQLKLDLWQSICKVKFKHSQGLAEWFLTSFMEPEKIVTPIQDLVEDYLKKQKLDAIVQFMQLFVPKNGDSKNTIENKLFYWENFSACALAVDPNLASSLFRIGYKETFANQKHFMLDVFLEQIFVMCYSGSPGWAKAVASVVSEAAKDLSDITDCFKCFESIARSARKWDYSSPQMRKMNHAAFFREVFLYIPKKHLSNLLKSIEEIRIEFLAGLVLCNQTHLAITLLDGDFQERQFAHLISLLVMINKDAASDFSRCWLNVKEPLRQEALANLQPHLDHPESIRLLLGLISTEDFSKLVPVLLKRLKEVSIIEDVKFIIDHWILPLDVHKFQVFIKESGFLLLNLILKLYLNKKNLDNPSTTAEKLLLLLDNLKNMNMTTYLEFEDFYQAIVKILPFFRNAAKIHASWYLNVWTSGALVSELPDIDKIRSRVIAGIKISLQQLDSPFTIASQINEILNQFKQAISLTKDDVRAVMQSLYSNISILALYVFSSNGWDFECSLAELSCSQLRKVLPCFLHNLSKKEFEDLLNCRKELWSELPSLILYCSSCQRDWLKNEILKMEENSGVVGQLGMPPHILFPLKRALGVKKSQFTPAKRKIGNQALEFSINKKRRLDKEKNVYFSAIPNYLVGSKVAGLQLKGKLLNVHREAVVEICLTYDVTYDDLNRCNLEFTTVHAILMHLAEDTFASYQEGKEEVYRELLVQTVIEALRQAISPKSKEGFLKYLVDNSSL